ncbi:Non-heme dioxygenase N-terminal domain-containing protein, partial [Cynara cardunculus var. scolymus]
MALNSEPTSVDLLQDSTPVIDYSLLTIGTADDRSKVVHDLGKACQDWGCFMLVNHGIPETLIHEMMNASNEFFNMTKEEKVEFAALGVLDPIRCSTGFNPVNKYKDSLWREYLRLIVHPEFHSMELVKGVSESLGFEASYMYEELNLDSGFQLLAINYYPSLAEFDTPRGLMPHTDHGLLTLLYENGVPGLEVLLNGKWVSMSDVPNANGKYKSKLHRTVVKDERKRITLVNPNGPSLDTIVGPSSRLVDGENNLPGYLPMKYSEYLELQTKLTMAGKHAFDKVRLHI